MIDELRTALDAYDDAYRTATPGTFPDAGPLAAACRSLLARIDARTEQAGHATVWLPLEDTRAAAQAARMAAAAASGTQAAMLSGLAARIEARMIMGTAP